MLAKRARLNTDHRMVTVHQSRFSCSIEVFWLHAIHLSTAVWLRLHRPRRRVLAHI